MNGVLRIHWRIVSNGFFCCGTKQRIPFQFLDSSDSGACSPPRSPHFEENAAKKNFDMDVSENSGTPKSSILIGFSIINRPFWGSTIFGNTHIFIDISVISVNDGEGKARTLRHRSILSFFEMLMYEDISSFYPALYMLLTPKHSKTSSNSLQTVTYIFSLFDLPK